MAVFVGTNIEFRRYIGPRLRNLVQQQTKAFKAKAGACQHCGSINALESAHVKGRGRNQIIDQILKDHSVDRVVTVNLDLFEDKFKEVHYPIEKSILILCHSCHAKYDSIASESMQQASVPVTNYSYQNHLCNSRVLPDTLEPSKSDKFKPQPLISKNPKINAYYAEGNMGKNTLIRKLISVGKQVFVEHFDLFREFAKGEIRRDECIERLVSLNVSNENGAAIRCGNAKVIFDKGTEYNALQIIGDSNRIDYQIKNAAQRLIDEGMKCERKD